jgi:hypothetical protein
VLEDQHSAGDGEKQDDQTGNDTHPAVQPEKSAADFHEE